MPANGREFDFVLLGASGSVGNVMARYLMEHTPADYRWAIAGRAKGGPALPASAVTPARPKLTRRTTMSLMEELRQEQEAAG